MPQNYEPHPNGGAYFAGNLHIAGNIKSEFYNVHGARIDPSGDDDAGVIDDSDRPFRTKQGAFDAFDALSIPGVLFWTGSE